MANLDPLKIATFARITRTEEAYAVHKLLQNGGNLNAALDAHYRLTDTLADDFNPIDCVEGPISLLRDIDDSEEEEIEEGQDALDEHRQSHLQDPFLAHAISLSLETAEIEKQLRVTASMIGESRCGVSEAPNVEQRQMKSSSSSVDEENESRGVPAASLINASALDEWLALYEAAMIAEIPDSRYRSGSLAPRTPSPSAEAQRLIREKQDEEYYESSQADGEKARREALRETEACQLEIQAARNAEHRKIEEEQWLTLHEAAMIAEIPDSRYRSGSLAPRMPSPSAEAQRLIREKQDEEYYESLQADREKALREAEACQLEIQAARNAEHRKMKEEQKLEKQLAEKEASLPLEPAIDEENAVTILIRMPSGNRLVRCFMKSHNLQTLFDFIDISRLIKPNTYRLVKPSQERL